MQIDKLLHGSDWCNVCTTWILYGFSFSNFAALCTDGTDIPVSCDKHFRDFWELSSNLSPISSNVSSVRTWRQQLTFLFFYGACFLESFSQSPNCTGRPGNFIRNLHRVSEHDFLLFIYILWIYTRSRNENSCLVMSQIAIITISTLTALMSNNNHNQQANVSALQMYVDAHDQITGKLNWKTE